MTFKPFFIHRYPQHYRDAPHTKRPKGFTVFVQPSPNDPRMILVRSTQCFYGDIFSKKQGRFEALQMVPEQMNPRHLDKFLAKKTIKLQSRYKATPANLTMWAEQFQYIFKYMV